MNRSFKLAALAAFLVSGAALAQEPYTPAEQTPPPEQTSPTQEQSAPAQEMPANETQAEPMATDNQLPEFSTLDKDGDGKLSEEEARSQSLIASRFGELDGNKDGALSSDEYQKALDKSKAPNP